MFRVLTLEEDIKAFLLVLTGFVMGLLLVDEWRQLFTWPMAGTLVFMAAVWFGLGGLHRFLDRKFGHKPTLKCRYSVNGGAWIEAVKNEDGSFALPKLSDEGVNSIHCEHKFE